MFPPSSPLRSTSPVALCPRLYHLICLPPASFPLLHPPCSSDEVVSLTFSAPLFTPHPPPQTSVLVTGEGAAPLPRRSNPEPPLLFPLLFYFFIFWSFCLFAFVRSLSLSGNVASRRFHRHFVPSTSFIDARYLPLSPSGSHLSLLPCSFFSLLFFYIHLTLHLILNLCQLCPTVLPSPRQQFTFSHLRLFLSYLVTSLLRFFPPLFPVHLLRNTRRPRDIWNLPRLGGPLSLSICCLC